MGWWESSLRIFQEGDGEFVKVILETDRWGHDRCGTNSASIPLDFDLSMELTPYKDIKNYEFVFCVTQRSG